MRWARRMGAPTPPSGLKIVWNEKGYLSIADIQYRRLESNGVRDLKRATDISHIGTSEASCYLHAGALARLTQECERTVPRKMSNMVNERGI